MFLGWWAGAGMKLTLCDAFLCQGTAARTDEPDHGRYHEHAQGAKPCLEIRLPLETFSKTVWTAMHLKLRSQADMISARSFWVLL